MSPISDLGLLKKWVLSVGLEDPSRVSKAFLPSVYPVLVGGGRREEVPLLRDTHPVS